jgi:hypothetical protein
MFQNMFVTAVEYLLWCMYVWPCGYDFREGRGFFMVFMRLTKYVLSLFIATVEPNPIIDSVLSFHCDIRLVTTEGYRTHSWLQYTTYT